MTPCAHTGCGRPATHAPKICVPATGWPIDLHQPLSAILMLKVCRQHVAEAFHPTENFKPGSPLRTVFEVLARGKVPPDFARAFVTPIRLDSDEFQSFERAQAKAR